MRSGKSLLTYFSLPSWINSEIGFITSKLPNELASIVNSSGIYLSRTALNAFATQACSKHKIAQSQFRRTPGFQTAMQLDAFFKVPGFELDYGSEDCETARATPDRLGV